jgi:hypothetical protein
VSGSAASAFSSARARSRSSAGASRQVVSVAGSAAPRVRARWWGVRSSCGAVGRWRDGLPRGQEALRRTRSWPFESTTFSIRRDTPARCRMDLRRALARPGRSHRGALEAVLRGASDPDRVPLSFLAFVGEEPVGTVSLIHTDSPSRPDLLSWLAALLVLPGNAGKVSVARSAARSSSRRGDWASPSSSSAPTSPASARAWAPSCTSRWIPAASCDSESATQARRSDRDRLVARRRAAR